MLYDAANRTGFVYHALYYQSRKALKVIVEAVIENDFMCDEEKEEINNFFKRCVLPKQRKKVAKRLAETKDYRRELIDSDFDAYKEMWNFYFAVPEIVFNFPIQSIANHFCTPHN